ncbi:hypothetical protein BS17DRAFT_781404, partial [Gyrodon lividus]
MMLGREKGVFLLNYSLQTSLFQGLADSIRVEGLVDDVGKGFGDLDGKLGWMTSSGLL